MNYYDTEKGREIEKHLDEDMQRRLDAVDEASARSLLKWFGVLFGLLVLSAVVGTSIHGG